MQIDSLIIAPWVIPVEPHAQVLADHAVAIHAGRILELLPAAEAEVKYRPGQLHRLERQALIPGLINAHSHASMNLLRGLADDLPLMTWLQEHIWPAEQHWMGEEFVADGSRLAIAEMLRGGTTCFNDMYFHPNVTAHAAAEAGIRAQLGMILIDFPSSWADGPASYIHKGLELRDQYAGHPLIRFSFAPHAPYSVSDDSFNRLRAIADELDPPVPIHIHLHETGDEIQQSLSQFGQRPLRRLERLGLLTPALQAVHMTQLEADEIELIAAAGCQLIHCPESNLKLASGFCPVGQVLQAGVNVALGTDGAASNNDLDMFSEMRSAALLAKGVSGDPATLPAATALRMATLNGAKALGLEEITGSIEPGKAADLVAVDLGGIHSRPLYNPISQLVYASSRHQVSQVWVNGRQLVKNGAITSLDETALLQRAQYWQEKIAVKSPGQRP
ncbi:MAG: TRZ/ATZ family hydrolase [Gammaproteobacteria bacterium SHHR-1]|uniref:TRZ/ATZ family hydrolase n=1 Tax=Magnetovirga frankeli TaxID=947516 RepID=UPI0012936065|nr:TRZ/ATZ family hydrolase [gamma proteobacterium SS-5]